MYTCTYVCTAYGYIYIYIYIRTYICTHIPTTGQDDVTNYGHKSSLKSYVDPQFPSSDCPDVVLFFY